jgi:hypothetical protein
VLVCTSGLVPDDHLPRAAFDITRIPQISSVLPDRDVLNFFVDESMHIAVHAMHIQSIGYGVTEQQHRESNPALGVSSINPITKDSGFKGQEREK